MAVNRKQGHKVPKAFRTEDASGIRMDSGPFIGIVKHVLDPVRSGRLQVFIPHLGGDPDNPNNLKIVQYASPFSGHTNLQSNPNGIANTQLGFETVRHHYGMWFTPPDVGVRVLVIFEASNANNGYWIACLPPAAEHQQLGSSGGLARNQLWPDPEVNDLIKGYDAQYAPAVEINAAGLESLVSPNILDFKKPPHRIQTKILANQGLLGDRKRGIDGASSMRESPSGAFGITTPGRTYVDQATDDLLQRVSEAPQVDKTKIKEKVDQGRKGGHQLIMDDGDANGESRRFKLRSAAGHQIIMDDTDGFIYISNSTGTNWIELTNDGQMLIYSASDITLRTGGDFNLKVDGDMNTEVNGNYNMKVRGDTKTETTNREEVVNADKDVVILGHNDITVSETFTLDVIKEVSINASADLAVQSATNIGITAGNEMNIDSGDASGWKAGGDLMFEGPSIGLNSGAPGSPVIPLSPIIPEVFTLADLNDTVKIGDIWTHVEPSASTAQTMLPKIATHEPYLSGLVVPLVSATGQPSKKV